MQLVTLPNYAQEVLPIINFSPTEYKASHQNWSVTQDNQRIMYFGNTEGLLSFNGSIWEHLYQENQKVVRSTALWNDKIFIGGFGKIGYWQRNELNKLEYISLIELVTDKSLEKEEIWNILPKDDKIYFQSFSIILVYDGTKIQKIIPPGNIMFIQKVRNKLYVEVINSGIYELNEDYSFELLKGTEEIGDYIVSAINAYNDIDLLISTNKNGVFEYSNEKLTIWSPAHNDFFIENQINKVIPLQGDKYCFGTIRNGLVITDKFGNFVMHFNKQKGLQNNTVLALLEDVDGSIWAGLDKGISLINVNTPLRFYSDSEGKLGTVYTALQYQQKLYIGTNQGVYYKADTKTISDINAEFTLLKGTQGHVWQLKNLNNSIIVGHNDGTFLLEDDKVEKISDVNGGYCTISIENQPEILIQATYTGLIVFKKQNGWKFSNRINGFSEPVKLILKDGENNYWIVGPVSGLHRIRLDQTFKNISFIRKYSNEQGLESDLDLDLSYINNKLVVKSGGKFYTYNSHNDYFEKDAEMNSRNIDFILRSGMEKQWFKVYRDSVELWSDKVRVQKFHLRLQKDYFNISILEKGRYLMCLEEGYVIIDSDQKSEKAITAPLTIDYIHFKNSQNKQEIKSDIINKIVFSDNSFILGFHQAIFHEKPRFRVKTEGIDSGWSEWTTQSWVEFNNLNPGKYTLNIQSDYSYESISIPFEVMNPWYYNSIAKIAYLLFIAGLGWMLLRHFDHKLKRSEEKLKAENERIIHEHKISIDNERLKQDNLAKSKELANSTTHLIRKNELLLEIKEELNNVRKSANQTLTGKEYQNLLHLINENISTEDDWNLFESNFNEVHEVFMKKLKSNFSDLSPADLRLAAYLKMNLSSKEIAPLFNISLRGLENKRYRLRKKINVSNDTNLNDFFTNFE